MNIRVRFGVLERGVAALVQGYPQREWFCVILVQMSWYAVSNLEDGRGFSFRSISAPSDATDEETIIPLSDLAGIVNPVWDAVLQRPVSLQDWYASRPDAPHGPGIEGRLLGPALEGTNRELPNRIGSFGARLTHDHPLPSDEWTKIPFDEVLWDTGGMFDPRHGAFVAERTMRCDLSAGGRIVVGLAVQTVRLEFAIYKNGSPPAIAEGGGGFDTRASFRQQVDLGSGVRTSEAVLAQTGDIFEVYVRHNIGADALLTTIDPNLVDYPEMSQPTAIYFMGMYTTR